MDKTKEKKRGHKYWRPKGKRGGRTPAVGSLQQMSGSRRGALTTGHGASASLTKQIESSMPLFPARISKALRYSTSCLLTVNNGIPTGYVIRANDLFDPDFTGTGHQPMGFDQMMISYNHFCVVKSWLKVTFRNASLSGSSCTVCIRQDADSAIITSFDRIVEFGGCVMETLTSPGQYGSNVALTLGLSIPKLQGMSNSAVLADPSLRGDAATSPPEVTYFHIMAWDSAGKSNLVSCDIVLEQLAWFTEPRDLQQSFRDHAESIRRLNACLQKLSVYEESELKLTPELSSWVNADISSNV